MKMAVINGPNLNMLGIREPGIYGSDSYDKLCTMIRSYCDDKGVDVTIFQSNHEGALVDEIQRCYFDGVKGIVINPGAYTHTSVAILDAVKAVCIPTVEVHISDVSSREEFRQRSYIRSACIATVAGHGLAGYLEAIDLLLESANK